MVVPLFGRTWVFRLIRPSFFSPFTHFILALLAEILQWYHPRMRTKENKALRIGVSLTL